MEGENALFEDWHQNSALKQVSAWIDTTGCFSNLQAENLIQSGLKLVIVQSAWQK